MVAMAWLSRSAGAGCRTQYHGSGCTLASAIATLIARGRPLPAAVAEAQRYTWQALQQAYRPGNGQHVPRRLMPPPPGTRVSLMLPRGLYAITPEQITDTARLLDMVRRCLAGGARTIQYRSKGSDRTRLWSEAQAISTLCREYEAAFIINDSLDLARDIGADGVHLGKDDQSCAEATATGGRGPADRRLLLRFAATRPAGRRRRCQLCRVWQRVPVSHQARCSKG